MSICKHKIKSPAFFQNREHFETLECDECSAEFYKCISCGEFLDEGDSPDSVYCCNPSKEAYFDSVRDILISDSGAGY